MPTYDEKLKEQKYKFLGKRGQRKEKLHNLGRGGYQTKTGIRINSDCNGAANILKKVAIQLGLDLTKIGKAALILPQRYDVLQRLSKSYRKRLRSATASACHVVTFKNPLCFSQRRSQ